MTRQEWKLVEKGLDKIKRVFDIIDNINDIFECTDSEFTASIYSLIDDYISLLQEQVDDQDHFIEYYIYDCEFGKKPLEVIINNEKRIIKTPDDLKWAIEKQ